MLGILRAVASFLFLFANTIFWCVLLYVFVILKILFPVKAIADFCSAVMVRIAEAWISGNSGALAVLQNIRWQVRGLENLRRDRSYLVCANHQSWTDIVVLQKVFNRRIPFLRFFIKSQLIYVPLLGLAWWALDFPRMKRHSKEYLAKHPEKRGEDLATTRRICAKLRGKRISVLNFLEGTRFTAAKHARQGSPYRHLLKPKTGGLAFVIESMGDQFDSLLDVTIAYPGGPVTLLGMLSGRLREVVVEVREVPIPREFLGADYLADDAHRSRVQAWVGELWSLKDGRLEELRLARR